MKKRFDKIRRMLGMQHQSYHATFKSPTGQEVMQELCTFVGWNVEPFVPGNSEQTAYNLGMRRVVQHIFDMSNSTEDDVERISKHMARQQESQLWDEELDT
jgi:hypothetical protein